MNPLQNRIDFCVIISVDGANPNGDPATMSWYPRVLYDGHGEISDVCLKRKIRNRRCCCYETSRNNECSKSILVET